MKKYIIVFALILTTGFSFGQAFMKGTKTVNVGVNTGYGLGVAASVEAGITDDVSAGLFASFSGRSYFGYRYSYILVGARGSYHLGKILSEAGVNVDKLDPYVGLNVGFRTARSNYDFDYGYGSGVYFGGFGGVRYQVNDKLGIYAEGGYPLSSLGVTFKF